MPAGWNCSNTHGPCRWNPSCANRPLHHRFPFRFELGTGFPFGIVRSLSHLVADLETTRQLTLLDRQGKMIGTAGEPGDNVSEMFFSPDSKRSIATRSDPQSGNDNLWMFDLARGVGTRFKFSPGSAPNFSRWCSIGRRS
jgi:hypothetical protein